MFCYLKHLTGCKTLQNVRMNPTKYLHNGVKEQSNNGGIKWLAGGWTLFLAENVILSENREWICQKYGEKLYHGVYNTLSSVACISILFGYFKHKGQGIKWANFDKGSAPLSLRISSIFLQSFGMICFSQLLPKLQIPIALEKGRESKEITQQHSADHPNAHTSHSKPEVVSPASESKAKFAVKARCPMDFRSKPDLPLDAIYGVERITRHPNLWALASLGVGTALATPFVIESMFFAGPILLATFGTAHQDSRFRRNMRGTLSPEKERITSNIPFLALFVGKQNWEQLGNEIKWLNCGLATIIVLALHVI